MVVERLFFRWLVDSIAVTATMWSISIKKEVRTRFTQVYGGESSSPIGLYPISLYVLLVLRASSDH